MTNTVLSNFALQYVAPNVPSRFRLFYAIHNPIAVTVQSQDVVTDQFGQPSFPSSTDLLAAFKSPFLPHPNFGPNRIGFVGEPLLFDGSRSTQRGNLPATGHNWVAPGAAIIQTFANTYIPNQIPYSQALITWNTPGNYWVYLQVTDRFGHQVFGGRQVTIYPDRDSAPSGAYDLQGLSGSLQGGGWTGSITTAKQSNPARLPSALASGIFQPITIMVETQFEQQPGLWVANTLGQYGAQITGQFYDDPRILFSGYINSATAYEDADKDTVTYQIQTADMILAQAGIHNIGYLNANVATWNGTVPTSLVAPSGLKGQLVNALSSADLYHSLLEDHCNIGYFHDIYIWRPYITDTTSVDNESQNWYWLTYSALTANEGTIQDAINTMAQNEFASLYGERTGAICIGPTFNMRGYEELQLPTNYGDFRLADILDPAAELDTNSAAVASPAYMVGFWGPNPLPMAQDAPSVPGRALTGTGPPIVANISDIPIYETLASTVGMWADSPQDITVRPIELDVTENFTQRAAFVKEVATLALGNNVWSSFYPVYDQSGVLMFDQSTGIMQGQIRAGTWQVDDQMVLPDLTAANSQQRTWVYLWEVARRRFYQLNTLYTATITGGTWTWPRLGDLYRITRQRVNDGPFLSAVPFYTTQVSFTIDTGAQTWQAQLVASEATSFNLGPTVVPPWGPPQATTPIPPVTVGSLVIPPLSVGSVALPNLVVPDPASAFMYTGACTTSPGYPAVGNPYVASYPGSSRASASLSSFGDYIILPTWGPNPGTGIYNAPIDQFPTADPANYGWFWSFFLYLPSLPGTKSVILDTFDTIYPANSSWTATYGYTSGTQISVDSTGSLYVTSYGHLYGTSGSTGSQLKVLPGLINWVVMQMGYGIAINGVLDTTSTATSPFLYPATGIKHSGYTNLLADRYGTNPCPVGTWIGWPTWGYCCSSAYTPIWPTPLGQIPTSISALPHKNPNTRAAIWLDNTNSGYSQWQSVLNDGNHTTWYVNAPIGRVQANPFVTANPYTQTGQNTTIPVWGTMISTGFNLS